jgi:hypothetical protein
MPKQVFETLLLMVTMPPGVDSDGAANTVYLGQSTMLKAPDTVVSAVVVTVVSLGFSLTVRVASDGSAVRSTLSKSGLFCVDFEVRGVVRRGGQS